MGPGRRAASSVPVVRRTGRRASSRALSTTRLTDRREPAGERSKRGVRAGGSDLRTGRGPGSAGARRGKRDRGRRGQQPLRYTASQAKRASASAATSLHLWRRPTKARRARAGKRSREACGAMRPCGKTAREPVPAPPPPAPGARSARFCRLTGRHAKTHATAPHTRLRRGITTLTIQCLDARYSTRDSTFSHSRERSQSQ